MGHRLSKIYTRTGDEGTTGLGDGARVKKFSPRVHALGEVDELNTTLGLLLAEALPDTLARRLLEIQHDLFDLGGELSIPGMTLLPADAIARLEAQIDEYNDELPPLKEFILPSGSRRVATCHFARADAEPVSQTVLQYINRLSDLLFVLARTLARQELGKEVMWDRSRFRAPDASA
jgi:cob(I)alamin adenosyltransferase